MQTTCGNSIQFTTKRERNWHYEFPRVFVSVCVYVCTVRWCPKSLHTNIFRLPTFCLSSSLTKTDVCLFPGQFASCHLSLPHSPQCPSLTCYYLDWDLSWVYGFFILKNGPKKCQEQCFVDNILAVMCCNIHCFALDKPFWMISCNMFSFGNQQHVYPSQSSLAYCSSVLSRHFQ